DVDILIRQIGIEHSWPENQVNSDAIELLPIVKDLCREAITGDPNNQIIFKDSTNQDDVRKKKHITKKMSFDALASRFGIHSSHEPRLNYFKTSADTSSTLRPIPYEEPQSSVNNVELDTKKMYSNSFNIKPIPYTPQKIDISDENNDNPYISRKIELPDENNYDNSDSPKLFMPPPNKKVIGDRMKIKTASGQVYEVDRWCPHAKDDLGAK
ncbi:10304_t:CDS:2, partial [Racocetra fulgida]